MHLKNQVYSFLCQGVLVQNSFTVTVRSYSNGSPYAIGPLSYLSATMVYPGQTVGWIKMPLGTEVGLGRGHIVLDGDPAPPRNVAQPPLFGSCLSLLCRAGGFCAVHVFHYRHTQIRFAVYGRRQGVGKPRPMSLVAKQSPISATAELLLWPLCISDADTIFLSCFASFFFFPRLISAVADWMSTILLHVVWP